METHRPADLSLQCPQRQRNRESRGKKKKEDPFSVEHFLPQSPESGSQWLIDFPDDKTRQALTELFGNLFLVRKESENPRMKNFDLPEKKDLLFPQGQDHPIYLTNLLKQQNTWTPRTTLPNAIRCCSLSSIKSGLNRAVRAQSESVRRTVMLLQTINAQQPTQNRVPPQSD